MTNLNEIKQTLAAATTYGHWSIHVGFDRFSANPGCYGAYLETGYTSVLVSALSDKDTELIANAPTWLAELVARVEELEDEVDFLRRYGNKACTAMADEARASYRAANGGVE